MINIKLFELFAHSIMILLLRLDFTLHMATLWCQLHILALTKLFTVAQL